MAIELSKPVLHQRPLKLKQRVPKKCMTCGKVYKNNKSLQDHIDLHVKEMLNSKYKLGEVKYEVGYITALDTWF